jgi:hypothetical protein
MHTIILCCHLVTIATGIGLIHKSVRYGAVGQDGSWAYNYTVRIDKATTGFQCNGLWPVNENNFTSEEFAGAELTEEPQQIDILQSDQTLSGINNVQSTVFQSTVSAVSNIEYQTNSSISQADTKEILSLLSPKPKALKHRTRKRAAERAEELTSSPYKKKLEEKGKHSAKQPKTKEEGKCSRQACKKRDKLNTTNNSASASSDTTPCVICHRRYNEPPFEVWVQCVACDGWYHVSSGPDDADKCYYCL